jgi:hypothetical protein
VGFIFGAFLLKYMQVFEINVSADEGHVFLDAKSNGSAPT